MAIISITRDTFNPTETTEVVREDNVISMNDWIEKRHENFLTDPWLCVLRRDGKNYYPLRSEWKDVRFKEDDNIHFLPHVGDPVSIIIAIIVVVVVVVFLFLSIPAMQDPLSQPSPVSSIDGRKNKARLNSPIEDAYGRNKLWATYISQPYVRFEGNNKQTLYQVLTLGQGDFDIESVLLEDTPADNFVEVEYTYNDVEVFDNNVSVCQEAVDINLLGTNEEDYPSYIGPFAVNPPNTVCQYLEIDYSFPNGCYTTNDEGDLKSLGVDVLWEAREIDREGNPITANEWYRVFKLSSSYSTNQPIRTTVGTNMPRNGRWEVRCLRNDEAELSIKGNDKITWNYVKGYRGNYPQPAIGTISIKTRASTNTVSNKINVLATRKLPVWDGAAWLAPAANRNPIWAMVNILKSKWGGDLTDAELDLAELKIAADLADANNETFDWVFDIKTTVWEAIKLCCQCCRSTPILRGTKISAIRDTASSVPVMLFNSNNIVENSLKISRQIYNLDGHDGLRATYFDHQTWKDETVTALLEAQQGLNPKTSQLRGITNRDQAIKTANYIWASEFHNREIVEFKTNHAGFSATYNDLIKVETDIMKWGQGGEVLEITGGGIITLSARPEFFVGATHNINFRTKTGGFYGPFEVQPVAGEEYQVQIVGGTVDETDLPISDEHEKPAYIFGPLEDDGKLCRITKVANGGLDEITITALTENYGRFINDGVSAPPIVYPPVVVKCVTVPSENIRIISYNRAPYGGTSWGVGFKIYPADGITNDAADYSYSTDGGQTFTPWVYASSGIFSVTFNYYVYGSPDPITFEALTNSNTIASYNEGLAKEATFIVKARAREVCNSEWVFADYDLVKQLGGLEQGWIELTTEENDTDLGNELLGIDSVGNYGMTADDYN